MLFLFNWIISVWWLFKFGDIVVNHTLKNYRQTLLSILFIEQKLQRSPSIPGMRQRMVWSTLSSVWPITSTPPPSTSHGQGTGWRSQRGYRTCVTATTVTGHSTEFQHWVSPLGRRTFTLVQWSIKPYNSLSPGAGVRQGDLVFVFKITVISVIIKGGCC